MPKTKQPIIKLAQNRQYFEFQLKLATKLGLLNQSVNQWGNGRTKPFPTSSKQFEQRHLMSDPLKAVLAKSCGE